MARTGSVSVSTYQASKASELLRKTTEALRLQRRDDLRPARDFPETSHVPEDELPTDGATRACLGTGAGQCQSHRGVGHAAAVPRDTAKSRRPTRHDEFHNRRSGPVRATRPRTRNGLLIRWSGVRFPGGPQSLVAQLDLRGEDAVGDRRVGVIVHGNVLSEVLHVTVGWLPVSWTERSHTTAGAPG